MLHELKQRFKKVEQLHQNLIQLTKSKEFSVPEFEEASKRLNAALYEYNRLSQQKKEN